MGELQQSGPGSCEKQRGLTIDFPANGAGDEDALLWTGRGFAQIGEQRFQIVSRYQARSHTLHGIANQPAWLPLRRASAIERVFVNPVEAPAGKEKRCRWHFVQADLYLLTVDQPG